MSRSYDKILDEVRNRLLPLAGDISPEQYKQVIVHLLSPHFINQDILNEFAIDFLAPEAVNLARINDDPWTREMFSKVLIEHQTAANLNNIFCFEGCANWHTEIRHASSKYVSAINLNVDLERLSLEDYQYEVFRSIGALIEANIQPYLRELLLQNRICRGRSNPTENLKTMKLGGVVNELYQSSNYNELFAPLPWGIRLNQWRNIAQHHQTRVENNKIIGTYSQGDEELEVTLTREELFNVFKRIHSILSVMKGVYSIFSIDNTYDIQPYITNTIDVRPDVKIFQMASAFATQGFDLLDISIEEKTITVILKDITALPENENELEYKRKRIIHTAQFICSIWSYFPVDVIKIEHFDNQGNLRCKIKGKGSDCETEEAIKIGRIPLKYLDLSQ
jgi:hypothetical protein